MLWQNDSETDTMGIRQTFSKDKIMFQLTDNTQKFPRMKSF